MLSCEGVQKPDVSRVKIDRLTNLKGDETYPRFSPDGKRVAFHSNKNGNWDIFIKSLQSGVTAQLTSSDANDLYADWSPDGRRMIFGSNRDGDWGVWSKVLMFVDKGGKK